MTRDPSGAANRDVPSAPPRAADGSELVLRPDLARIADWIAPGANLLDLGCGDGALLAWLRHRKGCTGYGVEIDAAEVLACAKRGVDVVQQNIEEGLGMFRGNRFDVCVLSMAIQATHRTEKVLREMSEVAVEGIVSFPNFGHWFHVWSILLGRMPVTREMPYQWYDTPNLHLTTIRDFELFLSRIDLTITGRVFLDEGREVRQFASKRATQAIYRFRRR